MGTFALGREAHGRVVSHIANLRAFEHGGISGRLGGCRDLGRLPRQYNSAYLRNAYYVVYCYGTPIAWVFMEDEASETGRVNHIPDWQYSATTTYHQGLVWEAWGSADDPNTSFSWQQNRGTQRGRTSNQRYGRGTDPTVRPPVRRRDDSALVTAVGPERDTSREHELSRQRAAAREAAVQSYRARSRGQTSWSPTDAEETQRDRMARLLDPRYANPDWTPEPLPEGAEDRDRSRVDQDLTRDGYRPAHP